MVSDVALAHGAAHIKGHGRRHIPGSLKGQKDPAHLGAVAMDNTHLIALCTDFSQSLAGMPYHLQLSL